MESKSQSQRSPARKGLFSVDASFAVIILLVMSYLFFMVLNSLNSSFSILKQRQQTVSLIVFTDELVRREAAVVTNTEAISNQISVARLSDYFTNYVPVSNLSSYGFAGVEIGVFDLIGNSYFSKSVRFHSGASADAFCIERIVLIDSETEGIRGLPGVMKVCVS